MPAGGFKTFSAGSVLTASDVNAYLMQGCLVFTNETARAAAITSPVEGMVAYLTAPANPAATGGTTAVPTGILTIYNGSAWVCVTPVNSYTSTQGNTTSTSYTATLTSGGTNPAVTVDTGTTALVTVGATLYTGSAGACYMGVAVSGATTVAASDGYALVNGATTGIGCSFQFVLTGLTAGTNTFTLNYKAGAFTGYFSARSLTVQGIA